MTAYPLREIKYRTYCEQHNRWEVYSLGDLIIGAATHFGGEGGEFKHWGQFTGLQDVAGKDIFEDDIIESGDTRAVVEYRVCGFMWDNQDLIKPSVKGRIIGNVRDNPELLAADPE